MTTVAVLTGLAGIVIGSASTNTHKSELAAARSRVASLQGQVSSLKGTVSSLGEDVARADTRAATAQQVADAAAARKIASQKAQLDQRAAALDARSNALDARERVVTGEEKAWVANAIPGNGIFVVGTDILPGVYQAPASPSGKCYYARLSSLAGGGVDDIISNGSTSGPLTIQVLPTDRALQLDGCAEFHKLG